MNIKYLESMNEQRFAGRIGNRKVSMIEGLGVAVDKQSAHVAFVTMKKALESRGYSIEIEQAGRFGFDKRTGWQFDETMTGSGHPDNWIPGSRGYYAMSKSSVVLFPKNEMQFKQDKPEKSNLTFKQDLEQAFKRKIGILEEKQMKSRLDQYLEAIDLEPKSLQKRRLQKNKRLKRTYGEYPQFKTLDLEDKADSSVNIARGLKQHHPEFKNVSDSIILNVAREVSDHFDIKLDDLTQDATSNEYQYFIGKITELSLLNKIMKMIQTSDIKIVYRSKLIDDIKQYKQNGDKRHWSNIVNIVRSEIPRQASRLLKLIKEYAE